MYVSVYTFFSFLKTFFPFFPPGPHFAEYLHWDVTEECEVRLVCKVRDRFTQKGVTIREMVRSHACGFILFINLKYTAHNLSLLLKSSMNQKKLTPSDFLD